MHFIYYHVFNYRTHGETDDLSSNEHTRTGETELAHEHGQTSASTQDPDPKTVSAAR